MRKTTATIIISMLLLALFIFSVPLAHAEVDHYYFFYGPYYESGAEATGDTVLLTYVSLNGATLDVTLSYPINATIVTNASRLVSARWNASSALNMTRTIDFLSTENNVSINLYVIYPNVPAAWYSLNVIDFTGMTNPYLQVVVTNEIDFEPIEFVVERHNLQ